jgi:hypothetical protein
MSVNKAAQSLGRMGRGKTKTLTQAERKRVVNAAPHLRGEASCSRIQKGD